MKRFRRRLASLLLTVPLTGCGGEPLTPGELAGTYHTTSWTYELGGQTSNLLALGGGVTLTVNSDLTTTGTMTIPAQFSETGSPQQLPLTGTVTMGPEHQQITLHTETFLDIPAWSAEGNQLTSVYTNGEGGVLRTTLQAE